MELYHLIPQDFRSLEPKPPKNGHGTEEEVYSDLFMYKTPDF